MTDVQLGRYPERGHYEFTTIAKLLDEGLFCHIGVTAERGPLVLPTIHGRIDRFLYVHGSVLARWLNESNDRAVCITATIVDAIVLARSAFNHSMNYRSVVVFGRAEAVLDVDEKLRALRAITEHVCAGRWLDVRPPSPSELQATLILRVPIETASAKVRSGPPTDASSDLGLRVWAGEIPLRIVRDCPLPDPRQDASIPLPRYLLQASGRPRNAC